MNSSRIKPYYETKHGKLYHANCLDILPMLSADVLLTDPVWPNNRVPEFEHIEPYRLFSEMICKLNPVKRMCIQLGCDSDPRILGPVHLPFIRVYWLRFAVPGHKGRILHTGDVAYLFGTFPSFKDSGRKLLRGEKTAKSPYGKEANHPCPRKKEHVYFLIEEIARSGETVIDPFFGSGTTGVVCEGFGINWIGIEIFKHNCDEAIRRLET